MGFLDGLKRGLGYDAVDIYNGENDGNYRERGIENTRSNNGWYKCRKCGKSFRKEEMDVDHIYPQALGEDNSRENLQLLCRHCNRSKQADMSESAEDYRQRKREISRQNRDDREFLKTAMKYKDKV